MSLNLYVNKFKSESIDFSILFEKLRISFFISGRKLLILFTKFSGRLFISDKSIKELIISHNSIIVEFIILIS